MKWGEQKPRLPSRKVVNKSHHLEKVSVILNGIPGKRKKFYSKYFPLLSEKFELSIHETSSSGHAEALSFELTEQNVPIIICAGGDGTLHQVVNGILKSKKAAPALGLIPLGTGNDFARAAGITKNPEQILGFLMDPHPMPTDVGIVRCNSENGEAKEHFFINECSVGMGPEVVRRLEHSRKSLGSAIAYLIGIVSTFLTHRPEEIQCQTQEWKWSGLTRVTAICNGQSFGNATYIAPDASVSDGVFNTFIAGNYPLFTFLKFLLALKGARKINDPGILYNVAKKILLTAPEKCPMEADGELIGFLPAEVEILPGKILFLR